MSFVLTKDTPPQELFNYVTDFLMAQGRKSVRGTQCAYRSPDGCKCAVGAVIPDDLYTSAIEGRIIDGILNEYRCEYYTDDLYAALHTHLSLLRSLQYVHDQSELLKERTPTRQREAWRDGFSRVAHSHGLLYDPAKHIEQYQLT